VHGVPAEIKSASVELFEDESIAPYGTSEVTWFVRINDAWAHISKWPAARSERLDAKPGMVWLKRTELELPLGTELMRVESRPLPKARKSPLEYLRDIRGPSRQTARRYFTVGHNGILKQKL
jgi:hypothetical protein